MNVPGKCLDIISTSLVESGFIGKVSPENPQELAAHYLDRKRLDEQIELIEKYNQIQGRFLEVGSGFGGLVTYLNSKRGDRCQAYGIEPSADAYTGTLACTQVLARENRINSKFVSAPGEYIPFESNSFDIVYSTSVLEHVKDPGKVMSESIRVLKPGGLLQFVIPNYGSWWEGHYGVLMLPNMPKFLFKLYVRLLGRSPEFVDTLQFINKKKIKKMLIPHQDQIDIVSWGNRLFEHRLKNIDFSPWASLGRLKKWIDLVHRFKLVDTGLFFCRLFGWETPFILTLRKKTV